MRFDKIFGKGMTKNARLPKISMLVKFEIGGESSEHKGGNISPPNFTRMLIFGRREFFEFSENLFKSHNFSNLVFVTSSL